MADYFTLASFMIPAKDAEQRGWLIAALEGVDKTQAGDGDAATNLCEEVISSATDHGLNFEDCYTPAWRDQGDDGIWINADENIDVDLMIVIIQAYLKKFHPKKFMGFEWANTCSKPRLDGFGGGAVYISADEVEFTNTSHWLDEQFADEKKCGGELLE